MVLLLPPRVVRTLKAKRSDLEKFLMGHTFRKKTLIIKALISGHSATVCVEKWVHLQSEAI